MHEKFQAAVQEFFLKERIERERSEEEMARLFVTQRILGLSSEALLLGDATDIDNQFPMRMTIYMYTRSAPPPAFGR